MYVGVCRFSILVEHSHSLKEKRSVVRRLRDRVRERFHIGLVEVGGQDTWQRADLAFSVLTANRDGCEAAISGLLGFVQHQGLCDIMAVRRESALFSDDWFKTAEPWQATADGTSDDWIPAAWKKEEDPTGG